MNNHLYKRRMAKMCGLLCLALLFKGLATLGVVGHVSDKQSDSHWNWKKDIPCSVVHEVTFQRAQGIFLDFENTSERDPEPTGQGNNTCKSVSRSAYTLCWLSIFEHSLTKSTLTHCTTSLQKRLLPPLFVLHHSWKTFLS